MYHFLLMLVPICSAQLNLMSMFGNGQLGQLASFATSLANSMAANSADRQKQPFINGNSIRPQSAVQLPAFGGALTPSSTISPLIALASTLLGNNGQLARSPRNLPSATYQQSSSSLREYYPKNALVSLANSLLSTRPATSSVSNNQEQVDRIPTLRQLSPIANSNFGIPQGKGKRCFLKTQISYSVCNKCNRLWYNYANLLPTDFVPGCIPFLGEVMQLMYGNCQQHADTRSIDAWGTQLSNALAGGPLDFITASRATCKSTAERQQCSQLRELISRCDIVGSIQTGVDLQRQLQRCEQLTGFVDKSANPVQLIGSINSLIGGELAGNFLQNFLG